ASSTSPALFETIYAGDVLHWVGYTNSDMSLASNYLENRAPGANDTVIFDTPPQDRPSVNASATANVGQDLAAIQITTGYTGTVFIDENLAVGNLLLNNPGNITATLMADPGFTLTVTRGRSMAAPWAAREPSSSWAGAPLYPARPGRASADSRSTPPPRFRS